MFKQLLISIILGALLGLILTSSYFYYKNIHKFSLPKQEETIPDEEIIDEEIIIEQKTTSTIFLDILTPEHESIIEKDSVTILGKTMSNSIIIINTLNDTFHTNSNDQGEFNIDIKLESGINIIHFTAISSDDSQAEKEILLTYSTAKI